MTQDELINDGWIPRNCKIGTLYFKGNFFGKLTESTGTFELRSMTDDMNPLGTAKTFDDIKAIQKKYYLQEVRYCEYRLERAKECLKQFE